MVAWADMMRKQIVMPAHLMDDNEHHGKTGRNLFADFSSVAERTGTYTGARAEPAARAATAHTSRRRSHLAPPLTPRAAADTSRRR